jgi:hypothetical protein
MENKTMKQTLNRASVVFAFVLMFFSLSAFAGPFEDGLAAGQEFCKQNPSACGITFNDTNGSTEQGKQECRNNPSACGITFNDTNGSTEQGKQECRNNPSACGITFNDTNGSTEQGKQECRNNPSACGITFNDTNGSTELGKQECRNNPSACGITFNDTNGSTEEGKNICRQNPSACGITVNNNQTLQEEAKEFCQNNSEKCGVTESILQSLRDEGKNTCKEKPEECFTKTNQNPQDDDVPDDFCENKTKNCYSSTYGLYLNAVNAAAEPLDANGNVSTILTDITMDVFHNDKDTALFMIKIDDLMGKINEENQEKKDNKSKDEAQTEAPSFLQNTIKVVTTVEEQKQLITSNNAIETANKIDYYPTNVISSSEEDKPIQLNISKIGAGEVISYPNGIACGEDCQENYAINYPVELFAVPIDSNVSLKEWQGDCEGKTNHITVIMDANKTCTAVFE